MICNVKFNEEFMSALEQWVQAGRRRVAIKMDTMREPSVSIWLYDYDLCHGMHVTRKEEIPSRQELIRSMQEDFIQRHEFMKRLGLEIQGGA